MKHFVRIIIAAFLYFVIMAGAFVALGDDLPDAPLPKSDAVRVEVNHRTNKKIFLAGVSLLAAAKTADAISTMHLIDRGGWENNPLLGKHPGPAKIAAVNATFFAGETLLFRFTEKSRHPAVRWLGRGYISFTIVNHARLASCNSKIDVHGPAQNCGMF